MGSLQRWCVGFGPSSFPVADEYGMVLLNRAFVVQAIFGIRNLFRGLITWDLIKVQEWYHTEHEHKRKNTIERWRKEVVRFLLIMLTNSWQTRCELVNEKDATRRFAHDLAIKLQPTPWYLPSASRHLLDRDETFFRTKLI